jgi:hypothetical protein
MFSEIPEWQADLASEIGDCPDHVPSLQPALATAAGFCLRIVVGRRELPLALGFSRKFAV